MSGLPDWKTMDRAALAERLTDLCNSGLSASKISYQFLNCPSANAVVGLVHRLQKKGVKIALTGTFGGRRRASEKKEAPVKPPAKPRATKPVSRQTKLVQQNVSWRGANNPHRNDIKGRLEQKAASPGLPAHLVAGEPRRKIVDLSIVPISRKLALTELTERTCKWPNGDPQASDFGFCGNDAADTGPYCRYHARISCQPPTIRQRAGLRSAERIS